MLPLIYQLRILLFSAMQVFFLFLNAQPVQKQDTAAVKIELKIPPDLQFYIDSLHTALQAAPDDESLLHLEPNLQYFERKGDSSRVAAVLYQRLTGNLVTNPVSLFP